MIRDAASRYGYRALVSTLLVAICLVGGFLLLVAMPDVTGLRAVREATPAPTAIPSPTPMSAMALSPVHIPIPADADCGACHLTAAGGVGTKPIPTMAHPLVGWTDCTACHAPGRLVMTAPGHTGLTKDECLACHQPLSVATADSAPPRPHHVYVDRPCISCHGAEAQAPLPTDMAGRTSCWICHNGTDFDTLFGTPAPSPAATPASSAAAGLVLLPVPGSTLRP